MNIGSDVLVPAALPERADIAGAADVFGLLADPGRLRILLVLRAGEANVGELSQRCGLSESATSHALRLLRAHQVVQVHRIGRLAFYRLADAHVADLLGIAIAHIEHTTRSQDGGPVRRAGRRPEHGRADRRSPR